MKPQTIFCLTLFSTLFWMKFTTDFLGWSVVECATAGFLLFLVIKRESIWLPQRAFLLPVLVLTFYSALSSTWSPNFHATLTGTYKLFFILLLFILFCNDRANWEKAMKQSILILGSLASLWILAGFPLVGSNHLLAGFIAVSALLTCARFFESGGAAQLLPLALFAAQLLSLFILGSLGALIAFGAGLFSLFVLERKNLRIFFALFAFLFLMSFVNPADIGMKKIKNPLNTIWIRKKRDPFAFERAQIWKDSFSYFINYAFLGSGMGTYRDFYPEFKKIEGRRNAPYAHNEFFNILCELGIAGMIILVWFVWSLFPFLKDAAIRNQHSKWISVATLCITHSLFDFNFRYPATLTVFLFSISLLLAVRKLNTNAPEVKWGSTLLLFGTIFLFSLPGLAEFIFKRYYDHPEKRALATEWSRKLDPFFSYYHSQTGKMRDLLVAIELEPRNVWYRRTAAQFYLYQWEKTREKTYLKESLEQYDWILKFAPNVFQFKEEADEIKRKFQKKLH